LLPPVPQNRAATSRQRGDPRFRLLLVAPPAVARADRHPSPDLHLPDRVGVQRTFLQQGFGYRLVRQNVAAKVVLESRVIDRDAVETPVLLNKLVEVLGLALDPELVSLLVQAEPLHHLGWLLGLGRLAEPVRVDRWCWVNQ